MYARRLTREELIEGGITEVTITGRVFKKGEEVTPSIDDQGYFVFSIYDRDEDGNKIKIPKKNTTYKSQYTYKMRTIGLHRLMWAWHYGEVPGGMVVDHISNKHNHIEDYYLDNLQLMTPGENLAKERDNWHQYELKCKLNKPRSFYEQKLEGYILAWEQAKKDGDSKAAHHLRGNVSQTRARLRYYDNHIEEYLKNPPKKVLGPHPCHARAAKRRELQSNVDKTRLMYMQLKEVYGKDDEYVKQVWGEWKLAIAMLQSFKAENKRA